MVKFGLMHLRSLMLGEPNIFLNCRVMVSYVCAMKCKTLAKATKCKCYPFEIITDPAVRTARECNYHLRLAALDP